MTEPDPLASVDPVPVDPDLADAPLAVKRAGAWLESTRRVRTVASAVGLVGLMMPMVVAALMHDVGGASEGMSALAMFGGLGLWGAYVVWVARRWGMTTTHASRMVTRYKELRELGATAPESTPIANPVDRMVARIHALAGDRASVRAAATRAADRVHRIEAELAHLKTAATGNPSADAALDAARDRLGAELERTRATVAETYAALAELGAGSDHAAELEDTVTRLAAEVEVDRATAARRAQVGRRQAQ